MRVRSFESELGRWRHEASLLSNSKGALDSYAREVIPSSLRTSVGAVLLSSGVVWLSRPPRVILSLHRCAINPVELQARDFSVETDPYPIFTYVIPLSGSVCELVVLSLILIAESLLVF